MTKADCVERYIDIVNTLFKVVGLTLHGDYRYESNIESLFVDFFVWKFLLSR